MASRSVRRRHKAHGRRLAALRALPAGDRRSAASGSLRRWRAEAVRRASDLGAPAAWALAAEVAAEARALDPSGELASDLGRVIAEAVASAAGRHLVRGSRPASDRARVGHVAPAARGF